MNQPTAAAWLACLLFACTPNGRAAAAERPPATRPSVLLIVSDDQGYGDLGSTGNPHLKTPHLDRLAARSIAFDRFLVSPLCAPTRASLMTGRYSLRTGVTGVSAGAETMRPDEVTIAEALRAAGYRTGLFGKWHLGENYPSTPDGQGFDESLGFNCGHWDNYFDTTLLRNGRPEKAKGYLPDVLTDAAIRFVSAAGDRPFFCHVAYNTPHSPFQVPDAAFDKYKAAGLDDRLASVYGMCENLDANVGRLLAGLDAAGRAADTIVIFLSDNGPNGQRFNAGMRGVKGSPHEGGNRVPFFLCWPGRFKEPRVVPQVAAHVDLFPTLVELCGVPRPQTPPQDGRSLVPLLEGRGDGWTDRALVFQHVPAQGRAAVRTQQHRLVGDGKGWALYDMVADPGQTKDVGGERPAVRADLVAAYERWWREVEPSARRPRPAIEVGHAAADVVDLLVPRGTLAGGLRLSGKHANNDWVVGWSRPEAAVAWDVDVVRGGRYAVSVDYLCPPADAGGRVRVAAGADAADAAIAAAPVRQVPSPDRVPRDEVYELQWASLDVGTLDLPAGAARLVVTATAARDGGEALRLKSVRLRRLPD